MSKKFKEDEEFVRNLINDNFYTTETLPDGMMDRVFEEKRRLDAIAAAKALRRKRVFKWAALPAALLIVFAVVFPTVMLTRPNDDLIHYADDDLVLEVIQESDIKTYYSGNVALDDFTMNKVHLYKAEKDGTPVTLQIIYLNEYDEKIELVIILTDRYTYTNKKYDACVKTMQVGNIEILYNTVKVNDLKSASVVKFTYDNKMFYFDATYYESGENRVEALVSQLIS